MPIEARDIETLLREAFPKAKISVQGDDGARAMKVLRDAGRDRKSTRLNSSH